MINPMYTYDTPRENMEDAQWKAGYIKRFIQMIPPKPIVHICDIGCGTGLVLKSLKDVMDTPAIYSGFDISEEAIAIAEEYTDRYVKFYCEDYTSNPKNPDVVLLIDVIEHVEDPYAFIKKIRDTSRYVIFHIPLENHCLSMLYPKFQQGQHDKVGHLHYYTRDTALQLLKDCGCEIICWEYTDAYTLSRTHGFKDAILKPVQKILFAISPDHASQIVGGVSLMVLCK